MIEKAAGSCAFCGGEIPALDYQEGRASVLSGKACCACCLDSGAWIGSGAKAGAADRIVRAQPRFVPTLHLDLALRLPGWRGALHGNFARHWLDVSVEGLRAVVGRRCAVGDLMMARIRHRPTKQVHEIVSTVRHVQESPQSPDLFVAGFLFANPSAEYLEMFRSLYGAAGILDTAAQAPGKDARKIG